MFSGFGLWWAVSSCLRLEAMDAGFDMAIFTQAIWNTTQGDWFYSSIKGGISLLGDHFAPILAVFAIPYRVWPHPEFLLGMQALAAASCVFPLARFVRKTGQSPAWAILCCICFALYSPVRNSVRFDFHPEVLAMPLLFWAFCFLEEKRTLLSSVFLALALAAKENIATVAFAFGVYACLKKDRSLGFGAFWIVFSAVYFYAVVHWIIPVLSGAPYFYLSGNFTEWLCLGWKPLSRHVINVTTLSYVAKVYGPLAFTSFFAPLQLMLTLPTLAQNILSRSITTRSLYFQYTATLTPFVFIASVAAMAKIRKFRRYWAYLILLTSVFLSGVSEAYPIRRNWIAITPHTVMVREKLRSLPAEASLRTHEFYAPHAANRKELHIFENDHPKEGGSWKARHTDLVAIDRGLLKGSPEAALDELRASGYAVSFEQDGFYILKRAANSRQ
ncbi:MAG TPA: DUF2079 domain-containing protein [Candidatus Omnitrophota bacterium]|nr:DUF2079 domain-containing protein [Candidatus Omnitrophota bacterium]